MKVIYIQPIFAPNLEMLFRLIRSVTSFIDYYVKNNYSFKCVFGGYCSKEEYWSMIEILLKYAIDNYNMNIIIMRFDKNYGKAYVVNTMTTKYLTDEEYIFTADSDIIYIESQPSIIHRLIEAMEYSKSINLNPSLVSLFQEDSNCHILDICYEHKYYYNGQYGHEMVCHPTCAGGVAGGCLFISSEFWKLIGGYKVLGVYASDDANIMVDSREKGYNFLLSNSIRCIHPKETNSSYQKWKNETSSKVLSLSDAVNDANLFWDK